MDADLKMFDGSLWALIGFFEPFKGEEMGRGGLVYSLVCCIWIC